MIEHIYFELDCDCVPSEEQSKSGRSEYSRVMCYNSDSSRTDAEDFLRGLPTGSYLVRPCSDGSNKLSLSAVSNEHGSINHYLIRLDNGYKLDGRTDRFCCLKSFLRAHSQYNLGLQVKLKIPIFAKSLFHMIEIWEYETSHNRWESFGFDQTYRLATLRRTVNPVHKFEDGTVVNLKLMTREVPCIYGVQTQSLRMRTVYGLCDKCTLKTVHPILKHSHHNKMSKQYYRIWEYHDGTEWRCFEYGKASFQHFLASYSLLLASGGSLIDKSMTISDSYGSKWYIDMLNSRITNICAMKTYQIRQREVHGISSNDVHKERERYISRDNKKVVNWFELIYSNTSHHSPPTWTDKKYHLLSSSSEEFKLISSQIPASDRDSISSVLRIQNLDSLRIFSKEVQLLGHQSTNEKIKVDLLWTESSMTRQEEAFNERCVISSIQSHERFYFSRNIKSRQIHKSLVLCKVGYNPSSSSCVVDDQVNTTSLHMDIRSQDAIVPLFAVFFSSSQNNTTTNTAKDTDVKTVSLEMKNEMT